MAIRGENIGTAYIKVIADGDDIDGEGIGKKAAADFDKGWTKELKKRLDDDKTIEKALGRKASAIKGQTTKITNAAVKGLREARQETFKWGGTLNGIKEALDAIADAQNVFERRVKEGFDGKPVRRFDHFLTDVRRSIQATTEDVRGLGTLFIQSGREAEQRWVRLGRAIHNASPGDAFRDDGRLTKYSNKLGELDEKLKTTTDRIARSFGKGGRNDFVNIMGIFIGSLTTLLPRALASAGSGIINFGKKITTAFDDAGGGVGGFISGFQALGRTLVTFAAGLTGLTLVVGAFVSIMSLAAGIVVALASSLTFALAGAIGVAAGAFVPLIAGAGVAIAAFKNMDAEQKKAFKGVGKAFSGLGGTAADSLFDAMGNSASALTGIIKQLNPVVEALAGAMGGVFLSWIEGLQSPATQQFLNMIAQTMPRMLRSIGQISANIGHALAGIWTAATPFVQEFLGWLAGVTGEFATFSTSLTGQAKITAFFNHMRTSLISVSGFLTEVIGLVGDLFSAGRPTGDSIFDSMTEAVKGWRDALADDPDILDRWFTDAKNFAGVLGEIVTGMGHLIDTLDSPATREFAILLGTTLAHSLETISNLLGPLVGAFNSLDSNVQGLVLTLGGSIAMWIKVGPFIDSTKLKLQSLAATAGTTGGKMRLLSGAVGFLTGAGGFALLADGANRGHTAMGNLESIAGATAIGYSVGGPLGAALAGTATAFWKMEHNTENAMAAVKKSGELAIDTSIKFETLQGTLDEVTGAYTKATRAAVTENLQKEGTIEAYRKLGVNAATLTEAVLGNQGAIEKVNVAEGRLDNAFVTQKGHLQDLVDEYNGKTEAGKDPRPTNTILKEIAATQENIKKNRDLATTIDKSRGNLEKAASAQREVSAGATNWAKVLKGVDKKVITRFENGGIPKSLREVGNLKSLYDLTRKEVKTIIKHTFPDKSPEQVQKFLEKLYAVDRQSPNVKITTNANDVVGDLSAVDQALNAIPGTKDIDIRVETIKSTRTIPAKKASGGILTGPTHVIAGEAGPEAIVPLNRALNRVDPAVRELSAIAQGMRPKMMAAGGVATRSVGDINVYTNVVDPQAVASVVLNRLATAGY